MNARRLGLILIAAFVALAGCSGVGAFVPEETAPARQGRAPGTPRPTPEPRGPQLNELLGTDGRLTVLILGSDFRKRVIGERMDTIIAATIHPRTGKVAMISLPRDTVNVPIGPGRTYAGRINGLFWELERTTGKRKVALRRTREALAYAFGIEIDYAILVDFKGLVRLIDGIGGIQVTLKEPFADLTMHLGRKAGNRGLRLKAGTRQLDGKTALAYARSRHTDSDYGRSRRQHQVLVAAAAKVRERGAAALPRLVGLARKHIVTDIPLEAAPALLELAARADLKAPRSIVLEPGRFARPGSVLYTIVPKVVEVRKLFARVFGPIG
jgi:polyisoprenyl-teichoic acid--peptidoglycan teichoic acid transferase